MDRVRPCCPCSCVTLHASACDGAGQALLASQAESLHARLQCGRSQVLADGPQRHPNSVHCSPDTPLPFLQASRRHTFAKTTRAALNQRFRSRPDETGPALDSKVSSGMHPLSSEVVKVGAA